MSVEENFVDGGHAPGPDGLMDGAEEDNVVHSRYGEDGPPQEHTTEDQLAAEVLGSLAPNLPQPVQNRPLSEFDDKFLFARGFPTLFPYGYGDVTGSLAGVEGGFARRYPVTVSQAVEHYWSM